MAEAVTTSEKTVPTGTVLIGKKPVMSYAMAALMELTESGSVTVKARGRAISRAVDVAEIVSKRFLGGDAVVKSVTIGTEAVGDPPKNVSTIDIKISGKPAN
ncbi:MAG: DNA-binding protein [Candidatus Methanosuratincola sp.]